MPHLGGGSIGARGPDAEQAEQEGIQTADMEASSCGVSSRAGMGWLPA
jgi:hypothetical protein